MALGIKSGDQVEVISGGYKGAVGRVLTTFPKKGQAIVEGINLCKRHTKAKSQRQPGGRIEKERPIALCKLMVLDAKTGRGTRFENAIVGGRKVRKSKATGNEI
jgi:large subunit ribosomal protein L24